VENGARRAAAKLKQYGHGIDRWKQHADFANKNCPAQIRAGKEGITWNDFVNMVKGFMGGETSTPKPSKPASPSNPNTSTSKANLVVDGYWGRETTKALQRALGTVADGEIWGQVRNQATQAITGGVKFGSGGSPVIKALQRRVNSKADGYLGANTIRSLQNYLKTPADGELWKPSTAVKEMQRRLNAGTFQWYN
jgi:N-acetylmuramoyl-L-alanine amidase CwlA